MNYITTFFKGIAMGAADVVPGVSGGTIAFITGIYDTLLESIRRINPSLITRLRQSGFYAAFQHINGFFLISLFGGIFTSILTLAKLISWLLSTHPIPLWSFFFGLIVVSVYHIGKQIETFSISRVIGFLAGLGFAYTITVLQPMAMSPTSLNFVLAGSIAICAMILPGISGSFILLLLGMYEPVLNAVKTIHISTLALFMTGCIIGLLSFSHLLSWLLKQARDLTLITLTGLMVGTLPKIWPWKETITWRTNSHGEQVPLVESNLLPDTYAALTGHSSQLALALSLMLLAIGLVLLLERFGKK
jgi:putative membrane protein